ncbi:MAG: hypothetical protein ACR2PF_19340 [Rhizobiaceae bacterium]
MIRIATAAALLASTALVAGCSGSNTYGTGVSQESQLISDLAGIVPLGTTERKAPIDYSSRPKLVRAPENDGTLPTPAETSGAQSAYFPTNPEERKASLNSRVKKPFTRRDGGIEYTIPEDVDAPSATGEPIDDQTRGRADDGTGDREPSAAEMANRSTQGKEARLKRMKELSGGVALGTGPRRYLTQPPVEYRKPAETASIGDTGAYEYGEKERKPIFSIFGGEKNTKEDVSPTAKKEKVTQPAEDS